MKSTIRTNRLILLAQLQKGQARRQYFDVFFLKIHYIDCKISKFNIRDANV